MRSRILAPLVVLVLVFAGAATAAAAAGVFERNDSGLDSPRDLAEAGTAATGVTGVTGATSPTVAPPNDSLADDNGGENNDNRGGNDDNRVETATTVVVAPGVTQTFLAGDAGSVTIQSDGTTLAVVSVNANAGFVSEIEQGVGSEVEVQFNGPTRVDFNAELEDGAVRVRVRVSGVVENNPGTTPTTVPDNNDNNNVDNSGPGNAQDNVVDDNSGPGNAHDRRRRRQLGTGLRLGQLRLRPLGLGPLSQGQPYFKRSRNPTIASLNKSLRSPATMWPAPATLTYSACGTSSSNSCAPSSLSRSLTRPRTSSTGTSRFRAASFSRSEDANDERVSSGDCVMKRGSQCQYQRPSSRKRTFFWSPERSVGRGRCGLYAAIASATSSSEAKPLIALARMNSLMRSLPWSSIVGATSTSTRPRATGSSDSPIATIDDSPPSDAPTRTGSDGIAAASARVSSAKAQSE